MLKLFILLTICISQLTYAAPDTFKLLTLNVHQFAYGIESKNNQARAKALAQTIREHHHEFDVIAFQEMWSTQTRAHVYEEIQNFYPYRYEDQQWGALLGLGFTSGLALYSKYPITRHLIYTYQNYRSHEHFAKKGLLGVELNVNGKIVYVFTTHLQAGPGGPFFRWIDSSKPSTTEMSGLQLIEAKEQIQQFITVQGAPVFLIGDLNIVAGSDEYKNDMALLDGAIDTFSAEQSKYHFSNKEMTHRIDYILSLTMGAIPTGFSTITDLFGTADPEVITDHLGVIGVFEL